MSEPHNLPTAARSRADKAPNGQASLSDRVRSLRLKTGGPTVRPRSAWLPWGLTAIALATALVFAYRAYSLTPADQPSSTGPDTKSSAGNASSTSSASASGPAASTGDVVLDAKGYIIAEHQIQLSPQVGGEIVFLDPRFKEGAIYERGDVLAKVDPDIYAAQVKSAKAALQVAKVNLSEVETGSALQEIRGAKALVKNLAARLQLARIDERNKRAAGSATPRDDMEKATVQIGVDQAAYDNQQQIAERLEVSLKERRLIARAQVDKAEADLAQAQKQLDNCTIKAPIDGIILTKKAEEHGYVNPFAFGAAGYLCEIADLRKLEVDLDIQERDISSVKPGQRCRIMPDAGQRDDRFRKTHPDGYLGVVSRLMPMANRSKGAITVRVKVEIPEKEAGGAFLLPDMGALVSFLK